MRPITAWLLITLVLVLSGCVWDNHDNSIRKDDVRQTFGPPPQASALVKYLNDNSARMAGLTAKVALDCKMDRQSVGIDGLLACSRQRNFRLKGDVDGNPVVDLGSNDQEFWYWVKDKQTPYLYHCSYADLARGTVRLPFPFQPDMVLTALGLGTYDPGRNYRVNPSSRFLELIEDTVTPDGKTVDKVTVFNRMEVRGTEPQVVAHALRTKQGQLICTATIKRVTIDSASGAIVPQHVVVVWPVEKVQMEMRLQNIRVAGFDAARADSLFSRRDLNIPSFDLARRVVDNGVQPAGAFK